MVTIDPADEAPEELTGAEFVEYMKNKKPVPTARVAEDEEVEPIAKPAIKGKQVGQMRATKGGKPAGEATEFGGHEGIDAGEEDFSEKHPILAKAVDIGKKVVGVVNKKTAGYVKDTEGIDRKLKELERKRQGDGEEEKKSSKKKSSKKSKGKILDEDDFDFDDEDDEDITALNKATSKQKVLPGNYKPAYGGSMGSGGYKAAYSGAGLGSGAYQPAYKTTVQTPALAQHARGRVKESEVEEEIPQPRAVRPPSDRFNIQNWQSMGFPNTMPQSARGNLFRPAPPRPQPQPQVIPMVRQPYQPREPMPPMRAPARAPMSGPMPRIGLNLNTMPQLMKPRATITPPRAQAPTRTNGGISIPSTTFFGVNLNEKKKSEQKPITNMGAGYKNVHLTVMDGLYPQAKYDPKKDPITKKSIIPKIGATITPNNFTMFGMKMKNRKI